MNWGFIENRPETMTIYGNANESYANLNEIK